MYTTVSTFTAKGPRRTQQDTVLVNDNKKLYAVFDGIGGSMNGDLASQESAQILEKLYKEPEDIEIALEFANEKLLSYNDNRGTTAAVVAIVDKQLFFACCGDARVILVNQYGISQLTIDEGVGHMIYNAIGSNSYELTQFGSIPINHDCRVYISTDGFHDFVSTNDYRLPFWEITRKAMKYTKDNCSVIALTLQMDENNSLSL